MAKPELVTTGEPICLSLHEDLAIDGSIEACEDVLSHADTDYLIEEVKAAITGALKTQTDPVLAIVGNYDRDIRHLCELAASEDPRLTETNLEIPDLLDSAAACKKDLLGAAKTHLSSEYTFGEYKFHPRCVHNNQGHIFTITPYGIVDSRMVSGGNSTKTSVVVRGGLVSEPDHVYAELVLSLLTITPKSGPSFEDSPELNKTKRILYVPDRIVYALRGKGMGKGMIAVSEAIARENKCELIYGYLVGETSDDTLRLISSHKKMGYQVFRVGKNPSRILTVKTLDGSQFEPVFPRGSEKRHFEEL